MRGEKARLLERLQSMSGLLFPAVRVNFSLATLVRHAHQRDRIASNSRSDSSMSIIHNTEALCVQQHPRWED